MLEFKGSKQVLHFFFFANACFTEIPAMSPELLSLFHNDTEDEDFSGFAGCNLQIIIFFVIHKNKCETTELVILNNCSIAKHTYEKLYCYVS